MTDIGPDSPASYILLSFVQIRRHIPHIDWKYA